MDSRCSWEPPKMEIIRFGDGDVIRTSGNIRAEDNGTSESVRWDDLFGRND